MVFSTRCPGKINLGLRILRERDDGFYELETIFCQIALADSLEFRPDNHRLTVNVESDDEIGEPERNLVFRAAREFECLTGKEVSGTWTLRKNIPIAAGLGGGSSDAAGALRILRTVYGAPSDSEDLFACASHLGADVPFFLLGGMARGKGKGDRLERLAWPGDLFIVLVVHDHGLATSAVYDTYRTGIRPVRSDTMDLVSILRGLSDGDSRIIENHLAPAAYKLRPELMDDLELLSRMDLSCIGLSGSGPTSFGTSGSIDRAREAAEKLRKLGRKVVLTRHRPTVPRIVMKDA